MNTKGISKIWRFTVLAGLVGLCMFAGSTDAVRAQNNDKAVSSSAVTYKTVKIDGLDIFYRESGDRSKPAILLLHGFPTSSFMFRNLIPKLADKFHVVAPDYPGFGQSSMPKVNEFDYTFENLTNVVDKFTQSVGINKYSIYVQDYGSPIGFRLAAKHPERIQSLIIQNGNAYEFGLSEAAAFLKTYGETRDPKMTETIRGFLKLETTKFQYLQGAHDPALISPDTWTRDQALLDRDGNADIQIALFADYSSNVKLYPTWHEYFKKSQPPTLVVWGKNDPFFTVKGVEEGYKKDLKNIEVNYFDGGHFALEEYTDEIAAKIREFLGRNVK
jgi:pimeloyl-ACP methyl ester carboxylesterase